MVGTIAPVVYGKEKLQQYSGWIPAILLYTFSMIGSACMFGVLIGFLGMLLPLGNLRSFLSLLLVGGLSLLYALHEFKVIHLPNPQWKRQVQAHWRYQFHPYITASLFGIQLGLGYATYVVVGTFHVVTIAALLSGTPFYGGLLLSLFGLGRAGFLWPLASTVQTYNKVRQVCNVVGFATPLVHLINGWLLAFTGGYLLAILA